MLIAPVGRNLNLSDLPLLGEVSDCGIPRHLGMLGKVFAHLEFEISWHRDGAKAALLGSDCSLNVRLALEHAIGLSEHLHVRHDLTGQYSLLAKPLQLAFDKVDQHVRRQCVQFDAAAFDLFALAFLTVATITVILDIILLLGVSIISVTVVVDEECDATRRWALALRWLHLLVR
jgi:hypothetical protein